MIVSSTHSQSFNFATLQAEGTMNSMKVIKAYECGMKGINGVLEGDYQHEGVKWMLRNELDKKNACGGILADDMGLGKTMQAITTMRGNPTPTLIVTMVSLVGQWKDALLSFGNYRPIIVNPSFNGMIPVDTDDDDLVVITSYSSFQKSRGSTPSCLIETPWGRIILDEGHIIRNHKTKVFQELSKLSANNRWILSGTPLQNSEKDLWTLFKWIGIVDCHDMNELCSKYLLRRTQCKENTKSDKFALPKLDTQVKYITFNNPSEAALYRKVEDFYHDKVSSSSRTTSYNTVMEGIIRCRQICAHSKLYFDGCERKVKKAPGRKRKATEEEEATTTCDLPFISDDLEASLSGRSTKVDFLCKDIKENVTPHKHKCLIFCTWTMEMKLVQQALKDDKVASLIFDGSLSRDNKENVIYNFKNSSIPVLILQISCGSTGLNLQCASRVYIVSPHWNPCVELQAIGRSYRKGQDKPVTCIRLVIKGSVEERCIEVQQSKATMIMDTMLDESIQSKLGALNDDNLSTTQLTDFFTRPVAPSDRPSDMIIEHEPESMHLEPVQAVQPVHPVQPVDTVGAVETLQQAEPWEGLELPPIDLLASLSFDLELDRILESILFSTNDG